jgi:hypothetical protein
MAYERDRYSTFYKSLISFYPNDFKKQLGDSMVQTFSDLCRERRVAGESVFGFALWTYANTFIGIIKEDYRNYMKSTAFKIVLVVNILASLFLWGTWWANGRDDTWLYVMCFFIMLTSLLSVQTPQKKDGDK